MSNLINEAAKQIRNIVHTPCLVKTKDGGFVNWEGKAIIFENAMQAGDYIRKHQALKKDVEFGDAMLLCVEYKELCKTEEYKKNLKRGYIIRNKHTKLDVQYLSGSTQRTLLFNTKEEANQFLEDCSNFFIGVEHEIIPQEDNNGLIFIDYFNYADIVNTDEYKELVESLKDE